MSQISLPNSSFCFLSQGAIIQEFSVAGHNLVLSFPSPSPYLEAPYFGETIGRVANRIHRGLIEDLNGQSYQLPTNLAGEHHLHGGNVGWGNRTFSGPQHVTRNGKDAIQFTYLSPDGEEGYPGTLELRVWYVPREEEGEGEEQYNASYNKKVVLEIEYEAELVGNECDATIVNVTNHSYFNLGDGPTIEGTDITMATDKVLAIDQGGIPTRQIISFPGVHADQKFTLGAQEPSIDHCFVMDQNPDLTSADTRPKELRRLVSAKHTSTGICLEVFSTEPSFQFYTGDYVDVPATAHTAAREARAGFCVEPGRFVNAINVPEWRDQVVLRQGQLWGSRIVYKAWKA